MADVVGSSIQTANNEVLRYLDGQKEKLLEISRAIKQDEVEKDRALEDIKVLESRVRRLDEELISKYAKRTDYQTSIKNTEDVVKMFQQTSSTLINTLNHATHTQDSGYPIPPAPTGASLTEDNQDQSSSHATASQSEPDLTRRRIQDRQRMDTSATEDEQSQSSSLPAAGQNEPVSKRRKSVHNETSSSTPSKAENLSQYTRANLISARVKVPLAAGMLVDVKKRGLAVVIRVQGKTVAVRLVKEKTKTTDVPSNEVVPCVDTAGMPLRVSNPEAFADWCKTRSVFQIVTGDYVVVHFKGFGASLGQVVSKSSDKQMTVQVYENEDMYTINEGDKFMWHYLQLEGGRGPR